GQRGRSVLRHTSEVLLYHFESGPPCNTIVVHRVGPLHEAAALDPASKVRRLSAMAESDHLMEQTDPPRVPCRSGAGLCHRSGRPQVSSAYQPTTISSS